MGEFHGYAGRILRINLSRQNFFTEPLRVEDLKLYLGGVGIAAKLLYEEVNERVAPLSERNKLIFATGPFVSTAAPGSGSVSLCFKSPLTGIFGESRSGSDWGPVLKKAGYDFLILEGRSKRPVYIIVDEEKVEIREASELVGKSAYEKTAFLKSKLGEEYEIASIGIAGENTVLYASVMFGDGSRAAGRTGAGAVMGAKNVIAIAVAGGGKISVSKRDEFYASCRAASKKLLVEENMGMKTDGTTGDLGKCDEYGDWPTKNWRSNSWGKGAELYERFKTNNLVGSHGCYKGCVLFCGRVAKVESGKWRTPTHEGCEYETISAFTAFIMNDNMDAAVHASYLCNSYGLDTISTGAAVAFAMDCYESGVLSKEELDGLDMNWGNMDAAIELIHKIAHREGIGDLLADGVARASKKIGRGSEKLAVHVKGLEGAAHDPRSGKALALTYAASNIGMSHIHPIEGMAYDAYKVDFGLLPYGLRDPQKVDRFSEKGKGKDSKVLHDFGIIPDVVGMCKFYIYAGLTPDDIAEILSNLTGFDVDGHKLLRIGERVYNLQRMFNVREGIRRQDDRLPERVTSLPEFGKYSKIEESAIENQETMLDEYYKARGWDEEGVPTKRKLKELSLDWTLST